MRCEDSISCLPEGCMEGFVRTSAGECIGKNIKDTHTHRHTHTHTHLCTHKHTEIYPSSHIHAHVQT